MIEYSDYQKELAKLPINSKVYLSGIAGSGKTTIAKAFLQNLLAEGIAGHEILILVPQRSLGLTYQDMLTTQVELNGGFPSIQTMGGIAQRMIRLFWPLVAPNSNFKHPELPPIFLTLETSQYYLTKICQVFFDKNYFQSIRAEKPRILSQILDNLNKAAVVGFNPADISNKLKNAWSQAPEHLHAYDEAQECANAFRDYCFEHNLLDFSLQISLFANSIWKSVICREYLFNQFSSIIYDNCEEDIPITHDILMNWIPEFQNALIISDDDAGFRSFLGADPNSASRLIPICDHQVQTNESWICSNKIQEIQSIFKTALSRGSFHNQDSEILSKLSFHHSLYFPKMMDAIADQIEEFIKEGTDPGKIAILAPFVSDALRFQIQHRLNQKNIEVVSHRPSRSLREETITNVLLTFAKIAHPEWDLIPSRYEVRIALNRALSYIDPIRADLITRILYQPKQKFWFGETEDIRMDMRERITETAFEQYQLLRNWILNYMESPSELDVFLARLFGELLSQPGFGFHDDFTAARVSASLIESIQKFRRVIQAGNSSFSENINKDYITMVEEGVIAALYVESWDIPPKDSVYLAPAYTFLMQNRSVEVQFWLDIGSMGWWQRLMQPLTQPYVLSRNWSDGRKWTDSDEYETNQNNLMKLTLGLLRRCEKRLVLHTTGYNESGNEERGPLLQAAQKILRHYNKPLDKINV